MRPLPFTALDRLDPIALSEMAQAGLMNRVDTKYLGSISALPRLLELAQADYRVVEIDGERLLPYFTCYLDTPDTLMYYEHARGRKSRQKVRVRRYESGEHLTFIEVKDKNNKGRTVKTRVEVESDADFANCADFIATHCRYSPASLVKQIENRFRRITLVRRDLTERITIDTSIGFHNLVSGRTEELPSVMVVEWKRARLAVSSPMRGILKTLGLRESGFSKYCIGMARTNPELRQNRFKSRLRIVERL